MALDFPSSPTDGQIYNNYQWSASSGAWKAIPTAKTIATTSSSAPTSASPGDIWIDTTDGSSFYWYDDGTSKQWVELVASGIPSTPVSIASGGTGATTITDAQTNLQIPTSPNYIINGAFDIWQRGTSSTTSVAYLADRWLHTWIAGTATVSQSTDVPSGSGLTYSLSIASTSGTNPAIQQRIESSNAALFAGKTMTISVWAKSTVGTGTLTWATYYPTATDNFTSVTADASGTFSATMTVGSWTRYSATFTANSLATRGYTIQFFRNVTTTSTTTFYAGAQLEVGTTATSFRRNAPSIQAELAACQRYYWRTADSTNYPYIGFGLAENVSRVSIPVKHPVVMRVPPTGLETSNLSVWDGNTIISTPSSVTILATNTSVDATWIYFDKTSAFTNKIPYMLIGTINLDSYIGLSAEL